MDELDRQTAIINNNPRPLRERESEARVRGKINISAVKTCISEQCFTLYFGSGII